MSKLLIEEYPLIVLPSLAEAIGLNEAIFLQQLHYWLTPRPGYRPHYKEFGGKVYPWVYNTYDEKELDGTTTGWKANFPFWSPRTIKRIVSDLRERGLILTTDEFNNANSNRTLWYTIDYSALKGLESDDLAVTTCHSHSDKLSLPEGQLVTLMTETPTETTSERTAKEGGGEKPPAPPIDTQSPTALPTAETQMSILFPSGGSSAIHDFERSIATASWDIRRTDIRRAAALFLRASGLPIPNDASTRKDWVKSLSQHVNDFGVKVLEELYPGAVASLRESRVTLGRPGSVTKTLAAVCADLNNGGNNGPHSDNSGGQSQAAQRQRVTGDAAKVGAAIRAKSRGGGG